MFNRLKTLPPMVVVVTTIFLFGGVVTATAASAQGGVEPLAVDCSNSQLAPHTGFQIAPACVSTAFGEVSAAAQNPSLLIVGAPKSIAEGETFSIDVSTRNLIRDRFLPAGQGGYYLESALLSGGLTRGHFHVACRSLASEAAAPAPDPVPEFFRAIEDGGGGAAPDTVRVEVPGKNAAGANLFGRRTDVQCTAWAGDGSHRTPMMQRANQTPAIDSVRIKVKRER